MRLKLKKCLWPCGVRVFSAKTSSVSVKYGNIQKLPSNTTTISNSHEEEEEEDINNNNNGGNKIMVVVDSSMESKGALQWALSHAVQAQDTVLLLLLHYHDDDDDGDNDDEIVSEMKKMCEMKRPGVKVKVVRIKNEREGNEGEGIVREAKKQEVTLLVIGQSEERKKYYYYWRWWNRVIMRRKRSRRRRRRNVIADYCIQNASCMTIAVRRKSKKLGGYLITTKRHKNFWLLA